MDNGTAHNSVNRAPALLVDTLRQFTGLMQGEIKLAKAEFGRIASRAGVGIVFLAIAFLMALVALNVLASAAVAYLAMLDLSVGTAALIVGGALLLIGLLFALAGKSRLSADALTPDETVENLRADLHTVKEASNV